MDEDKIEEYVDRTGFAQDTEFVLKELNKVYEAFKKLDGYRFRLGTPVGMTETVQVTKEAVKEFEKATEANKKLAESEKVAAQAAKIASSSYSELAAVAAANEIAMKRLAASKKEVEKAFKDGKISEEQYLLSLAKIKEQQTAFSVSQQQVNLSLKNLEKEAQAAEGSLNEMRAQLSLAQMAWDKLSETDRQSEIGAQLLNNINTLNKAVSELEQSSGRFQRNVGNYQGSARIIVDALKEVETEITNLKARQTELQNLSKTNPIGFKVQGGDQGLKDINAQLERTEKQFQTLDKITSNPQFLNIAGKSGDLNKELRFFTQRLNELEASGLKNTKVYDDIRKRLAELTDQIGDTRAEIKALSSDTRSFDLFSGSVAFAADAFQTLAGAAALAGGSEEEVARITQRLIAVQTVANGVKGIATQLTEKGTAANKVYAFVQGLVSTSMDKTAASAARLKAALGLIAIAATVIGAILIAMSQLDRKLSETRQQQKNLNDVLKEGQSEYVTAVTNVNRLRMEINAAKEGFVSKKAVVERYNETIGKTTGQVKTLDEAEKALAKNAEAYIQFTLLKAAANIALGKAAEQAFEAQFQFETATPGELGARGRQIKAEATITANAAAQAAKDAGKSQAEIQKAFTEAYNAALAEGISPEEKNLQRSFEKIAADLNAQALKIAKTFKFDFFGNLGESNKKAKDGLDDVIAALRRTAFEAKKASDEADIELLQSQQDITPFLNQRLELINREKDIRIQIIRDTATFETSQAGITMQEIERINEERDRRITATRIEYIEKASNAAREAQQAEADYILGQIEQINNEEVEAAKLAADKIEAERQKRLRTLSIDQNRELTALNEQYAKGLIDKEEYEERKQRIENDYTRNSLLVQLAYYKELIKISNLSNDEREKALEKIAEFEKKLSDEALKRTEVNADKQKLTFKEQVKAASEQIRQLGSEIAGLGFDLVTASFERQKNAIQDQIDLLDEKAQKEIDYINQTVTNEEEKANRIATIEAQSAARRRVLEAEQRKIDQQKARFDRIRSISQIVANTAQGVTAALASIPPNPVLAAVVGAIGAVQIARVLATPIPRYKYGKGPEDKYEGPAVWGDGGKRELKISADGSTEISGTTPTLTHVRRNDIIIPDADMAFRLANANAEAIRRRAQDFFSQPAAGVDMKPVANGINRMGQSIVKAIKNKKEIHFNGLTPSQRAMRYISGNKEYFDMNGID